ncbi:hypothetical protein PRZ48_014086 [Zasmidium cellare]|uniref:F-box domain-containing protein n=1 Tax=Zasmidium cellare TaxID=395010 RepID=A0ABR0DZY1_ZASCE|nr:hypothetical protein PRZ48_014086 [Zasmidium cellare]
MASGTVDDVQNETTSPAANKVLNTVELLETILLDVDFNTLLVSQAVNKTFASTIADSPKLQEKLFFKPPPKPNDGEPPSRPTYSSLHHQLNRADKFYTFGLTQWHDGEITVRFNFADPTPAMWKARGSWRRMYLPVVIDPELVYFELFDADDEFIDRVFPEAGVWTWGKVMDAFY